MIQDLKDEVWIDIKGWEKYYQVSNYGRVKSKERSFKIFKGYTRFTKSRILKEHINGDYLDARLTDNGITKGYRCHRLVALNFIPNPNNKPFVNHIDHNPKNNHVSNLEWCTHQENIDHMMAAGRHNCHRGAVVNTAKLNEEDVINIIKLRSDGYLLADIAKKYNVTKTTISLIVNRKSWKHLQI